MYSQKSHQRNKTNRTQHKKELVNKIFFPKWLYFVNKRASNIILVCPYQKAVFRFISSEIKNQFFFWQLGSFFTFQGPKLECYDYQNHGKTQEKIKLTLYYRHYITGITRYIMDIISWTLYCKHYDCMTLIVVILLGEINVTCKPVLLKFITSKFAVLFTKH